ncbi:MAG TPA: hypothetical protein VFS47_14860 [Steroidobacteraceae bacterium]|nr:hypothetical protein [Steroidobacteraceae bacterium]
MNRARLKPWIVWLLPLFALRAFVPVGFMLGSENGVLAITFCSSIAEPAAADVHAQHHHHAQHQDDGQPGGHHHSEAHERSICPYGLTGPADLAYIPTFEPNAPARAPTLRLEEPAQPSLTPTQTEPIRGPPPLA